MSRKILLQKRLVFVVLMFSFFVCVAPVYSQNNTDNMCGTRLGRIQTFVPEFFGSCGTGTHEEVLDGRYRTWGSSGCRLGNVLQSSAIFVVSREGGDPDEHLVVQVACGYGFLVHNSATGENEFVSSKSVPLDGLSRLKGIETF